MIEQRRRFCIAGLLAATVGGSARSADEPPRNAEGGPLVGYVSGFTGAELDQAEPLIRGLADHGWIVGGNIRLESHFTHGEVDRTRAVIRSLVNRRVAVLVVRATTVAHIARDAAPDTPIVLLVSDPLATGLISSLARPGSNLTGLSLQGPDLAGKRLEYLRMAVPRLRRVGFLGLRTDANAQTFVRATQVAAEALGLQVDVRLLDGLTSLQEGDFQWFARAGCQAVAVQPIFTGQREQIVQLALRQRLAVVSNYTTFARVGALLTLGPDEHATTRRAAYYVHRILRGAAPGDLPVEQPSRFTLAVNRHTARLLGVKLPEALLVAADQVFG